jgi:hypothetical protein
VGGSLAWRPEHLGDRSQYSWTVGKDFVVPEPENPPTLPPQLIVPQVMVARAPMVAAIGFDD